MSTSSKIGKNDVDETIAKQEEVDRLKSELTKYLPLTGGKLSNSLWLGDGYGRAHSNENGSTLLNCSVPDDMSNFRALQVCNALRNSNLKDSAFIMSVIDNSYTYYRLFGEHSKPSGSYTGNGDTTERVINTGGIGNVLIIIGNDGYISFVFPLGSTTISNSGVTSGTSVNTFGGGVLKLKSGANGLNASGKTYTYYVA